MTAMKRIVITLATLASLALSGCNSHAGNNANAQTDSDRPDGPKQEVTDWIAKNGGTYESVGDAYQSNFKGNDCWAQDYRFTGKNGFGMPIPCHVVAYFVNGNCIGSDDPESFIQKEQREQAAKIAAFKADLSVAIVKTEPKDSWAWIKVNATIENKSKDFSIKGPSVHLEGRDAQGNIVVTGEAYATGQVLNPGQKITVEGQIKSVAGMVSIHPEIGQVYNFDVVPYVQPTDTAKADVRDVKVN